MTTTPEIPVTAARIPVSDGTQMIVHVAKPAPSNANGGGILVFQEAYGVTGYLQEVAVRLAGIGLVAVVPELYHRSGDGNVGSYDAGYGAIAPWVKALTREGQAADVRAAYEWLAGDAKLGVEGARIAAVGFCMGGRTSYLANASAPLAAAVSFYGTRIPEWFDLTSQQHAPLLMFWGRKDEAISHEEQRLVADTFDQAGLQHTEVTFSEAGHGFFRHTRSEVYAPRAAGQAWALCVEFLRENGVLRAA